MNHEILEQLEPEELDPGQVILGNPEVSSLTLYEQDGVEAGLWQITPGEVTDVEATETFMVIKGRAVIEYSDGRAFTVGPGNSHHFEGGEETTWKVEETLLKAYWIKS
ncbi:MAG: DUF861 domain-containing protein [Solirubrobacterales bacterium]|nr:DUF861 domain-containing protein [Solirubrobacterales bacterium]